MPSTPDPSDGVPIETALVARVRAGDAAAFEQLFRRYYDRLVRFALLYLRRTDLADEVVQDVFLRVWARRAEWVIPGTVQSYLYTAVRNRAVSALRHDRIVGEHERDVRSGPEGEAVSPPADAATSYDELALAARRAIDALPDRMRQAFVLHREHGLSYREIAEVMQISVKAVEHHLGAALKRLRTSLAPWLP